MNIYVTSGVQTIAPRLGLQLGLGLGFVLGSNFLEGNCSRTITEICLIRMDTPISIFAKNVSISRFDFSQRRV